MKLLHTNIISKMLNAKIKIIAYIRYLTVTEMKLAQSPKIKNKVINREVRFRYRVNKIE